MAKLQHERSASSFRRLHCCILCPGNSPAQQFLGQNLGMLSLYAAAVQRNNFEIWWKVWVKNELSLVLWEVQEEIIFTSKFHGSRSILYRPHTHAKSNAQGIFFYSIIKGFTICLSFIHTHTHSQSQTDRWWRCLSLTVRTYLGFSAMCKDTCGQENH